MSRPAAITAGLTILVWFYGVYLMKQLLLRRKGIITNQIARGSKPRAVFVTELIMKAATMLIIPVQLLCLLCTECPLPPAVRIGGAILGCIGDGVFTAAVITMRDSWRAGIPEKDRTELIRSGIYSVSRNPAFLGFDLMYLGLLLLCGHPILLLFTVWAMVMLHLQILQEEAFLPSVFGQEYLDYRSEVRRYLGRYQR